MKVLLIFLSLLMAGYVKCQVTIMGSVKDQKGRILVGANIILKDTYDGTTTDSTGKYIFYTTEKGNFIVIASNTGYKTVDIPVNLLKDTIQVNFILNEVINELTAVIITAGSYEASDKKKGTVLKPLDIVTTAGANADISATIQTLPGAQKIGEQEGLFIRGGSAEESKIIIDGTVVNNFFYSAVPGIAQRGRFSAFLFNGTVFSSGGYSAVYGQALSSVLNLESIDIPEKSEIQVGLSPIFASLGLQQVASNKKYSYGLSYNWANLTLYQQLVKQAPDFFKAPDFHTVDANFRFKTKKNGVFKIYAYYNTGSVGLRTVSLDSVGLLNAFNLSNQNLFTNIHFKQFLGNGWKLNTAASISYNKDAITTEVQQADFKPVTITGIPSIDQASFKLLAQQWMVQGRVVIDKKIGTLNAIRFGTEIWHNTDSSRYASFAGKYSGKVSDWYKAAFAEADLYITNDLAFRPGIRAEHSELLQKMNIAPRAALSFKIKQNSQLTADYGIFYQTPERKYISGNTSADFLRADHYILTYQQINSEYTFRTQLFYKKYVSLLKTTATIPVLVNNEGSGYAKGIEIFWRDKKTIKNFDYWISYSYLDTKRLYNEYPIMAQPTFAATHNGSIVMKKFWVKQLFGVNWSWNFSSGRPYYNPNKKANDFLSDRTIAYSTNNFSLNWLPKIGKANSVVVFGMNNVFNEHQVFGYNYSNRLRDADGNLIRTEVNPPAARSFFLGIFLSWGVDRSQQNINSNL